MLIFFLFNFPFLFSLESKFWDVNGAGDEFIQGFSTSLSLFPGSKLLLKVNTPSSEFRVDVFRLSDPVELIGNGTVYQHDSFKQPRCLNFREEGRGVDCGNWRINAEFAIPSSARSGLYVARLVRTDLPDELAPNRWRFDYSDVGPDPRFAIDVNSDAPPVKGAHTYGVNGRGRLRNALIEPRASHVYFIVKESVEKQSLQPAQMLFVTSDSTWQAYNDWNNPGDEASTYGSFVNGTTQRIFYASLNRPLRTRRNRPINAPLGPEFAMIRFLERQGYDVAFAASQDIVRDPQMLFCRKIMLSVGHDEYWSGAQRAVVEQARDQGVSLAFFSGNEVYWRVRYESSPHESEEKLKSAPDAEQRVMIVYKETQSEEKLDPEPNEWTGTFRDARDINPLGANPENALTGTIFTVNAWRNDPLVVPQRFSSLRFWRHTDVAAGKRTVLYHNLLCHEWDEDISNGFRPAGLIRMSETHADNVLYISDHGSLFDSGSATHHLVMYRAESGALVFGAGTVGWSFALDPLHDHWIAHILNIYNVRVETDQTSPDPTIQQATVNLFADMGVFPAHLEAHLHLAQQSQDTEAPEVHFNSHRVVFAPTENSDELVQQLELSFTAVDSGGGVVASVEASFNGNFWQPAASASLRSATSADWKVLLPLAKSGEILFRASDDSCNLSKIKSLIIDDDEKDEL